MQTHHEANNETNETRCQVKCLNPLEGESQKPSREATAEAVGGNIPERLSPFDPLLSPHRLAGGRAPWSRRLPLKGGVMGRGKEKRKTLDSR